MLPLAHAGHYIVWVLYAVPVLIVVGAIIRSTMVQRRMEQESPDADQTATPPTDTDLHPGDEDHL